MLFGKCSARIIRYERRPIVHLLWDTANQLITNTIRRRRKHFVAAYCCIQHIIARRSLLSLTVLLIMMRDIIVCMH